MAAAVNKLTFGWWNTGICPGGKKPRLSSVSLTANIIKKLIGDESVDFLGLAEIDQLRLTEILEQIALPEYQILDGTFKCGRATFDTGAIFNAERLKLHGFDPVSFLQGRLTLKLATRFQFTLDDDYQTTFHVFISHWPSQVIPNSESRRVTLGSRLRMLTDGILRADPESHIILMGDYNEEPFHESIEGQLLATRDRSLVTRYPAYFYNPFWRHLGETYPYQSDLARLSFAGTCFLSSGQATKWKTVDQIIFSSVFLKNAAWYLNENSVKVLHLTFDATTGKPASRNFDHFPIVASIERKLS